VEISQTETSNTLDFGTNTWLVALTNDRFLFLDSAMLTSSVDTQSIRHDHVQAVSASQGFMFGKIMVDLGSRMLVIDNSHKSTVKVMASLANKWLKELGEKNNNMGNSVIAASLTPLLDMFERLDKLASLGAFSDKEFNEYKERLLSSDKFKEEKEKFLSSSTENAEIADWLLRLHIPAQSERPFRPSVNAYSGFTVNSHSGFSVNDFYLLSGMSVHT